MKQFRFLWRLWILGSLLCLPIYLFKGNHFAPPWNNTDAQKVIQAVVDGRMKPDRDGAVMLPWHQAYLSAEGRIYITRRPDNLTHIYFAHREVPMDFGSLFSDSGYLYSTRPLKDEDFTSYTSHRMHPRARGIAINMPAASQAVYVEQEITPQWRHVSWVMN